METLAAPESQPLLDKRAIADMLGVPFETVKSWRTQRWASMRPVRDPSRTLPPAARQAADHPVWLPSDIIDWAVDNDWLSRAHSLQLHEQLGFWSMPQIADYFGVLIYTVRERWYQFYLDAIAAGDAPPMKALPAPAKIVDGVPLWVPNEVINWGIHRGKLESDGTLRQRNGTHWVAPDKPVVVARDPVSDLINLGQLWDFVKIAEFFGVRVTTVKMWRTQWSAGKNFPAPDGGTTASGTPAWKPNTVIDWGVTEKRVDERTRQPLRNKGGRPAIPTDAELVEAAA